jgi:ParB family chromosome partitioning protein
MALSPAVEVSYLKPHEQANLFETIESEDRTPSHAQAIRLRRQSEAGKLNMDATFAIMTEEKPNQKEQIKLKTESIQGFFPKGYSPRQMQDTIIKLLAEWQQKRERAARNRDSR